MGWFIDEELETSFDFGTILTGDITLYAKWSQNVFELIFDTLGGNEIAPLRVNKGQIPVFFDQPTKDGFVFFGWYAEDDFQNEYTFEQPLTADTTIYAKWEAQIETADGFLLSPKKEGGYAISAKKDFAFEGELVIPALYEGVVINEILTEGFKNQTAVTKLTIGDNIDYLGFGAFDGMTDLEEITVTYFGCNADVLFPEGVPINLKKLFVTHAPENVTDSDLLNGFVNIEEFSLSGNITQLGAILSGLTNLKKVTLPFIGSTAEGTFAKNFGYIFGSSNYLLQSMAVPETLEEIVLTGGSQIWENSFYNLSNIKKVVLPDSITKIGQSAFDNCSSLTEVVLGNGVKEIDYGAFSGCGTLAQINLPEGLTTIGKYAFSYTALVTLNLPSTVNSITLPSIMAHLEEITVATANNTFTAKEGILFSTDETILYWYPVKKAGTSYTVPNNVKKIGTYAFEYANLLTSINFNEGLEEIGVCAFRNCLNITSITLPSSVRTIGQTAFSTMENLTEFYFPTEIDYEGSMSLGKFLLSSSPNLTSLTVPHFVTNIPEYFVSGSENLTTLTIEGEIISIGQRAFANTPIEELALTFADNATIGEHIFINCASINKLYIVMAEGATILPLLNENQNVMPMIIVDSDLEEDFKVNWSTFASYITSEFDPSKLFVIEDGVLLGYVGGADITDIEIPDTVNTIACGVFEQNTSLKTIVIPQSVHTLGERAFYKMPALISIEFLHTQTDSLRNMVSVKSTGTAGTLSAVFSPSVFVFIAQNSDMAEEVRGWFATYVYLRHMVFAKDALDIKEDCVFNLSGDTLIIYKGAATSYTVPAEVKTIGRNAFDGNATLTSIDFNKVENIGTYAFQNSKITQIVFPQQIKEISSWAFNGAQMTSLVFENCAVNIGENAFNNCTNITSIDFGNNILSIGYGAFMCAGNGIDSIILPASITYIGESAFEDADIDTIYCRFEESIMDDWDDGNYWTETFYGSEIIYGYTGEE